MLETLAAGVEELVGADPTALSDAELSDALVGLHTLAARLEAATTRLAGVWDARRAWDADRAKSGAAWLALKCGLPVGAARERVALGRELRAMPSTEAAWLAGEINGAHVRAFSRARSARTVESFARDEEMLVGIAASMRYVDFSRALAYWVQVADPDGVEQDAKHQRDLRRLHLARSLDGMLLGDMALDPVGGTIVYEQLRRIEDELFAQDWAAAKAVWGDQTATAHISRTPAQRRADALVEMATRAGTAPAGGQRPEPLFTVLVGYETLAGRICELADGTVVTPGSLLPWLNEAYVERVVFGSSSRVLDIGVRRRLFTGALRRAIEVRDRTCFDETCDVPADRCQVDHIQPWAAGGATRQDNGRLACAFHNRRRHRPRPPPS